MNACTDANINLRDDRSEKIPYDYAEYPIYVRHSFLSAYPNYAAPVHWHDDIEFITISEGEMSYNINGEIILLRAGEGVFVNARQMHFGFSESFAECEFTCIILHPMLLSAMPDTERQFILPILQNRNLPYIHLTCTDKWQAEIISGINTIYDIHENSAAVLKIQSIFSWIWALVYEHMPKESDEEIPQNNNLSILKNMVGFIQQHYTDKISLRQIAAHGGIGQSKCCRLFQEYLHQTPNDYLISYRLDKAASLLRQTDMSITEIAYETGFNGASYFAETFRKYYQASPTEYQSLQVTL